VKRAKTWHGQKQKKTSEYEVDIGSRPTSKRHAHVSVSHAKHTNYNYKGFEGILQQV
jgi:hypothetical protein